jgi:hypothetical protein
MTYKEFYFWLEGFMTNRDWTLIKQTDIESIQDKMKEVKDEIPSLGGKQRHDWMVPIPVNPFTPNGTGNPTPPWTITCNTKTQLND